MWWFLAVGALAVFAVWWGYNRLVTLRNRVHAAWADLDVQLERRSALIPNLVATVEAYAAHERDVLARLSAARADAEAAEDARGRSSAEAELDTAIANGFLLAEAYPDLKADARFRDLHTELVTTENKIAFSRQLYNDTATAYRTRLASFPTLLYAGRIGFAPPELFAADAGTRGAAQVALD